MINFGTDAPIKISKFLEVKVNEIKEEIPNVTIYILVFDDDKKALSAGYGCRACISEALLNDSLRTSHHPHNRIKGKPQDDRHN